MITLDLLSNLKRHGFLKGKLKTIIEEQASGSAKGSYRYARDILKMAPFPAGEEALAESGEYSYYYAMGVLKAPFPMGEEAIAKDARDSYLYARYVLKAPFPMGEKAIAENDGYARQYKQFLQQLT